METKPTQGFNVETVKCDHHDKLLVWDVSGEDQTKWRQFYLGTEGEVYEHMTTVYIWVDKFRHQFI